MGTPCLRFIVALISMQNILFEVHVLIFHLVYIQCQHQACKDPWLEHSFSCVRLVKNARVCGRFHQKPELWLQGTEFDSFGVVFLF